MSADVDIKQLAIVRDEASAPTVRRSRHMLSRYVIPGVLLVGFLALVAWSARDVLLPPTDVWVVPVLATQSAVQNEGMPLFQAAGWIEPRPTPVRVAALAPGVVARLLVVEDQAVKAGEPVAELIKDDAQLAYDRAATSLKLREAEYKEAGATLEAAITRLEQPVHLQAALSEAEALLAEIVTELQNLPFETRRAQAELEFAEADYESKQASSGAISQRSVKEAKSVLDAAQATIDELHNRASTLAQQEAALVGRRDALAKQLELLIDEKQAKEEAAARLEAASARAEQSRVALAEAQLRLDRMTVRAPIDGRVYQLVGFPGTTLTGGMGPVPGADGSTVVTLYRPDMLQLRVDVRFEDIPKVSLGQSVRINNPALAEPLAGKVLFVSSEANIQKNTLEVKVAMDAPPAVFKPEMLVDATFLAPKAAEGTAESSEDMRLYVPQQLVMRDDSGAFVWVADHSQGVARKTPVVSGHASAGGMLEVTEGLTVASRIIARGHETLADGKRIRIVEEADGSVAAAARNNLRQPLPRLPHAGE